MSYIDDLEKSTRELYYNQILPFYHYQIEPFYEEHVQSCVDYARDNIPYLKEVLNFMSGYTPKLPSHPLKKIAQFKAKIEAINQEGFASYSQKMITARVDQCAEKENVSSSEAKMIVGCVFKINDESITESFASCIRMTPFNFFQKIEVAEALLTCAVDNVRNKIEFASEVASDAVKVSNDLYGLFKNTIEHFRDSKVIYEITSKGEYFGHCVDELHADTREFVKLADCFKSISQSTSADLNYFIQCAGTPSGQGLLTLLTSTQDFLVCVERGVYHKQEEEVSSPSSGVNQCVQDEEGGVCKVSGDQSEVNG